MLKAGSEHYAVHMMDLLFFFCFLQSTDLILSEWTLLTFHISSMMFCFVFLFIGFINDFYQ